MIDSQGIYLPDLILTEIREKRKRNDSWLGVLLAKRDSITACLLLYRGIMADMHKRHTILDPKCRMFGRVSSQGCPPYRSDDELYVIGHPQSEAGKRSRGGRSLFTNGSSVNTTNATAKNRTYNTEYPSGHYNYQVLPVNKTASANFKCAFNSQRNAVHKPAWTKSD